jgi:hypothetical protein
MMTGRRQGRHWRVSRVDAFSHALVTPVPRPSCHAHRHRVTRAQAADGTGSAVNGPATCGTCGTCGRALARCEWCGETGLLPEGSTGGAWPVERRPDWDGTYHQPCREALEEIQRQGSAPGYR